MTNQYVTYQYIFKKWNKTQLFSTLHRGRGRKQAGGRIGIGVGHLSLFLSFSSLCCFSSVVSQCSDMLLINGEGEILFFPMEREAEVVWTWRLRGRNGLSGITLMWSYCCLFDFLSPSHPIQSWPVGARTIWNLRPHVEALLYSPIQAGITSLSSLTHLVSGFRPESKEIGCSRLSNPRVRWCSGQTQCMTATLCFLSVVCHFPLASSSVSSLFLFPFLIVGSF